MGFATAVKYLKKWLRFIPAACLVFCQRLDGGFEIMSSISKWPIIFETGADA